MTDATICHDQQLDMWYIQRELHIEEIFPLTLEYIKDQQKENDRLRELVRAAWRCIHTGASCSDCRLIAGGCTLQTAMRELGVEADG